MLLTSINFRHFDIKLNIKLTFRHFENDEQLLSKTQTKLKKSDKYQLLQINPRDALSHAHHAVYAYRDLIDVLSVAMVPPP